MLKGMAIFSLKYYLSNPYIVFALLTNDILLFWKMIYRINRRGFNIVKESFVFHSSKTGKQNKIK